MTDTFKSILFKPAAIKSMGGDVAEASKISLSGNAKIQFEGVLDPTGTFRYDGIGSPLKSTQQLNIDFSKFENHTFFNSAESKLQIAFERVINQYP